MKKLTLKSKDYPPWLKAIAWKIQHRVQIHDLRYSNPQPPILEILEVLGPSTKVICVRGETSDSKISNLKFHLVWRLWAAILRISLRPLGVLSWMSVMALLRLIHEASPWTSSCRIHQKSHLRLHPGQCMLNITRTAS